MPVFRALPPGAAGNNRLLAFYRDGLRRHWRWPDRLLGAGLALVRLGTGWSSVERRLLPAAVRSAGLSMAERRGVHRLLNPAGSPMSANMLRNKALFAAHVAAHRLAAPATFDPAMDDLETWLEARAGVIVKPGYSSKGRGVLAFVREGDRWRGEAGELSRDELVEQVRAMLDRHGVVQERLRAHAGLADLSPDVLPTLRIVTCRDEQGAPEACATVLRLGAGDGSPVDNFNAGGLAVRLDRDGRCSAAFRAKGGAAETSERHPATGHRIAGRPVPDLAPAVALAIAAHRTLADGFTSVGWDIGLSDRGPMLIEGNWNPGTDIIQLVEGAGIDDTRLGELYRFHLGRIPGERWRSARALEW